MIAVNFNDTVNISGYSLTKKVATCVFPILIKLCMYVSRLTASSTYSTIKVSKCALPAIIIFAVNFSILCKTCKSIVHLKFTFATFQTPAMPLPIRSHQVKSIAYSLATTGTQTRFATGGRRLLRHHAFAWLQFAVNSRHC